MFNQLLRNALDKAFYQAKIQRHHYVTVEHLLLILLDDPEVNTVLQQIQCDINQFRKNVETTIQNIKNRPKHYNR